ncbi:hypothetical protein OAO01_06820, partial [Oligoflexia bacterium]|nr:hypothetical protein [Oligoflexia bacterium]
MKQDRYYLDLHQFYLTLWDPLPSLSRSEGWQPDKAIWALAYFQKTGKFQEEMAQLANFLLQEEA